MGEAMELDEFVTKTLTQIATGVRKAQEALEESGVLINPDFGHRIAPEQRVKLISDVEFDVAVTTTAATETKAGGGLTVASVFNAGAHHKKDATDTAVNRIRFTVPIMLPRNAVED
jgi:hypothetical protein